MVASAALASIGQRQRREILIWRATFSGHIWAKLENFQVSPVGQQQQQQARNNNGPDDLVASGNPKERRAQPQHNRNSTADKQ